MLIECYVINNNQTTPLRKRLENAKVELRPGSRPQIVAARLRPGERPEIGIRCTLLGSSKRATTERTQTH